MNTLNFINVVNKNNSDINHIQNKLADLFSNKNILNEYSLISKELEQGELFFFSFLDKNTC